MYHTKQSAYRLQRVAHRYALVVVLVALVAGCGGSSGGGDTQQIIFPVGPPPPPTKGLTLDNPPALESNQQSPTFIFSWNNANVNATLQTRIDSEDWQDAPARKVFLPGLTDGEHTVSGQLVVAGEVVDGPVRFTWRVDTQPPDISMDVVPTRYTVRDSAVFAFSSSEPQLTYETHVDGVVTDARDGRLELSNLQDGEHVVSVAARDAAGNRAVSEYRWTVDRSPPHVTSVQPSPNVSALSPAGIVVIKFDDEMDATTLTDTSVFLVGVSSTLQYEKTSRRLILRPNQPLQPDAAYDLTLTTDVKNAAGQGLVVAYTSNIRVGPTDTVVSPLTPAALSAARVVTNDNGDVLAVWLSEPGRNSAIHFALQSKGQSVWSVSREVIRTAGGVYVEDLHVVAMGDAFVLVWRETDDFHRVAAAVVDNTEPTEVVDIESGFVPVVSLQVAANRSECVIVVGRSNGIDASSTAHAFLQADSKQHKTFTISDKAARDVAVAANAQDMLAVWQQEDGVYGAFYDAGDWQQPVLIDARPVRASVVSYDKGFVVFGGGRVTGQDLVATVVNRAGVTTRTTLTPDLAGVIDYQSVSGSAGVAIAVVGSRADGTHELQALTFDGTDWRTGVLVNQPLPIAEFVLVSGNPGYAAVWLAADGRAHSRISDGANWSGDQSIATDPAQTIVDVTALASGGYAVTWGTATSRFVSVFADAIWGAPEALPGNLRGTAVAADGAIVALFPRATLRRRSARDSWSLPILLSTATRAADVVWAEQSNDGKGSVLSAWVQRNSDRFAAYAAISNDLGLSVREIFGDVYPESIATGFDGSRFIVSAIAVASGQLISRIFDGSQWGDPVTVAATTGRGTVVVTGRPGEFVQAWGTETGNVFVSRELDPTHWSEPFLHTENADDIRDVTMRVSASAVAIVVRTENALRASVFDGASWTLPTALPGFAGAATPAGLYDLDGGFLLIAAKQLGSSTRVQSSAFRAGAWSASANVIFEDSGPLDVFSARNTAGHVVVLWGSSESASLRRGVRVASFNGTSWTTTELPAQGHAESLWIDGNDIPHALVVDSSDSLIQRLTVMTLSNGAWLPSSTFPVDAVGQNWTPVETVDGALFLNFEPKNERIFGYELRADTLTNLGALTGGGVQWFNAQVVNGSAQLYFQGPSLDRDFGIALLKRPISVAVSPPSPPA